MTDTASMNHDLRAAAVRHIAPRLDSLERLQRLCDRWIGRHTEQFDLFTWHTTAERFRRRKAFAEAAFYLYVCHPLGDDDGELQELRTLIVDRVNDPRYGALVARHPRDFDLYCPGPLYVSARGELGDGTTAALTDILRSRAIWAIPRRPSDLLGLWHFCTAYGYPAPSIDPRVVLRNANLAQPPGPVDWTLGDAYALTHIAMYYTNFGVPHPDFPKRPLPYDLGSLFDGLILRFMAEHDVDIVLELVAAGVLQQQMRPSLAALALDWAVAQADARGYVPHRDEHPSTGAPLAEGGVHTWADNYHTTLIAGALARSLRRDWPEMALGMRSAPQDNVPFAANEALALGQALACLARYDLGEGAALLEQLLGTPTQRCFHSVYAGALEHIRTQQSSTGRFGFSTDDPYARNAEDDESDRCRSLLAAVARRVTVADTDDLLASNLG